MPRDGERGHRRHRSTADEESRRLRWKSEELLEPREDLVLDVDRGVVAAGAARIHRRGQRVGKDAHHRGRRVDPAPETWMAVAKRVRLYFFLERAQHVVGRDRVEGGGSGDQLPRELRWHGMENRALGEPGEMIGEQA